MLTRTRAKTDPEIPVSKTPQDISGRRFVLLQGPSSRFFAHLGRALRRRGATVWRIGFAPGDALFWSVSSGDYVPYTGTASDFARWFDEHIVVEAATDIVMLGDRRSYHKQAVAVAARHAAPPSVWVVEHGLLRPNRLLVEAWGRGGRADIGASFLRRGAPKHSEPVFPDFPSSFLRYAAFDMAYHSANVLMGRFRYPNYQHHALDSPLREYAGWAGKACTRPHRRLEQAGAKHAIARHEGPLFLFPLQLETDFQIRDHGTGEDLPRVLERVVESFAVNAPMNARLIVKRHPLDNGHRSWARILRELGARFAIADRLNYIDHGTVESLLGRTQGVVTVNSTVGLTAILAGVPCRVLGRAVYDLPGLTSDQPLDAFWTGGSPPDPDTAADFRHFLDSRYHVPGAFDGPGAIAGAENLAECMARGGPV